MKLMKPTAWKPWQRWWKWGNNCLKCSDIQAIEEPSCGNGADILRILKTI